MTDIGPPKEAENAISDPAMEDIEDDSEVSVQFYFRSSTYLEMNMRAFAGDPAHETTRGRDGTGG